MKVARLHKTLFQALQTANPPGALRLVRLPGQNTRRVLEFDGSVRVAVHICNPIKTGTRIASCWLLKAQPLERGYPALVCLPDQTLSKILRMYLVPEFGATIRFTKRLRENDSWFNHAQKVANLANLHLMATEKSREWQHLDEIIRIGDVELSARAPIVSIGKKRIEFRPIDAELFKQLVQNRGECLSSEQLAHLFANRSLSAHWLAVHICEIRRRLGPRLRKRINVVPMRGYVYDFKNWKTAYIGQQGNTL